MISIIELADHKLFHSWCVGTTPFSSIL